MNSTNTRKLFHDFPKVFDMNELKRGFECQDGWFDLLCNLADNISDYSAGCSEKMDFRIFQIRQEMGQMRIYISGGDQTLKNITRSVEKMSQFICELDGEPASALYVCAPHWFRPLCEKCAALHGCMTIEDYCLEDVEVKNNIRELPTVA